MTLTLIIQFVLVLNKMGLPAIYSFRLCFQSTETSGSNLQNAAEKPPSFLPSWTGMYVLNAFVVGWVLVVGFGFGGWASMTNFVRQVDTFGLFAKCYQCNPPTTPAAAAPHWLRDWTLFTKQSTREKQDQKPCPQVSCNIQWEWGGKSSSKLMHPS